MQLLNKVLAVFLLSVSAAEPAPNQPQPQPLGDLIDVGGYRVHIYCTGQGSPPVVVASGGFSFDWGLVQPKVAEFTRICTYDPSGTAWSDRVKPGDQITCSDRVSELHRLLKSAGINGPYVMVGFSIGGLVARLYATQYPSEIAGMVLVDHAFIETGSDVGAAKAQPQRSDVDSPPILISKTPIALDLQDDQNFAKLPERDRELHRWALSIHSDRPTPEMAARCFSEVAPDDKSSFPLGNKPLVVISTTYDSPQYAELQHKLLMLSRNSKQLIAQNSTHMVIIDQPEVVVRAIEEVVEAVRQRKHAP
ncbi:MAG TPA: alpha/beta hydrolase [Bryobacteraceae bacterium]|nr:alpha/beta hydrolase [Bryobacteraceae bacterium]